MKRLLTLLCGLMVAVGMKPVAQAPVPGAETAFTHHDDDCPDAQRPVD